MFISTWVEPGGSKDWYGLKYNIVLKWQITFQLAPNAAKNTHGIQKSFKLKLFGIKFCPKKSARAYVYPFSPTPSHSSHENR